MTEFTYNISSDRYDVQQLSSKSKLTNIKFLYPIVNLTSQSFNGCIALTSIDLPISLQTIEDGAFEDCSQLTAVNTTLCISYIGCNAFENCNKLRNIDISKTNVSIIEKNCFRNTAISSISLPRRLKKIDSSAFSNCSKLAHIQFNNNIEEIGDYAFYKAALYDLCLSSNKQLQIGSHAFELNNISSAFLGANITYIGKSAFRNCKYLQSLSIEYADTLIIDEEVFANCQSLKEIIFVRHGIPSLTLHENVFESCISLSTIELPNNTIYIGDSCFSLCNNLQEARLPDTVEYLGNYVFANCPNLSSFNIPQNIKHIGNSLFQNDKCLTNLTISNTFSELSLLNIILEI